MLSWLKPIAEGATSIQELTVRGKQLTRQAKHARGGERDRLLEALDQLFEYPPAETVLQRFIAAGLLKDEAGSDQISIVDPIEARLRVARALARVETLDSSPLAARRLLDPELISLTQDLALFNLEPAIFARWLKACPDIVQGEAQQLLVVFAASLPLESEEPGHPAPSLLEDTLVQAWATTLWRIVNRPYLDNPRGTAIDREVEQEICRALQTLSDRYRDVLPRLVPEETSEAGGEPIERLEAFVHPAIRRVVSWWNGPRPGPMAPSGSDMLAMMLRGKPPGTRTTAEIFTENDPPTMNRSEQRSRLLELAPWQVIPAYLHPMAMRNMDEGQFRSLERAFVWMAERGDLASRTALSGLGGTETSWLRRINPTVRMQWTARDKRFALEDWRAFEATLEDLWSRSEEAARNEHWLPDPTELGILLDAVERIGGCTPQIPEAWLRLTLAPFGPHYPWAPASRENSPLRSRALALAVAERLKCFDLLEAIVAWPEHWASGLQVAANDCHVVYFHSKFDVKGPFSKLKGAWRILRGPFVLSGGTVELNDEGDVAPAQLQAAPVSAHHGDADDPDVPEPWSQLIPLQRSSGKRDCPAFLNILDTWCQQLDERAEEAAVLLHQLGRPDSLRRRWRDGSRWPFRPEFIERVCRLQLLATALEIPLSAIVREPFPAEVGCRWLKDHPAPGEGETRAFTELSALGKDNLPPSWSVAVETLRSMAVRPDPDAWPPELLGWLKLLEPEFIRATGPTSGQLIPKYRSRRRHPAKAADIPPSECHCWPVHELLGTAVGAEWRTSRVRTRALERLKELEDDVLIEAWLTQLDGTRSRTSEDLPPIDGVEKWVLEKPERLDRAWHLVRNGSDSGARRRLLAYGAPSRFRNDPTSRPWYFEEAMRVSPEKRAEMLSVQPDSPAAIPALRCAIQDLRGIDPFPVRTFAWYALQLQRFEPWCPEVLDSLDRWLSEPDPFCGGGEWFSPATDEDTVVTHEGGVADLLRLLHRLCRDLGPARRQKLAPWLTDKVTRLWKLACQLEFQDETTGASSISSGGQRHPLSMESLRSSPPPLRLQVYSWYTDSLPEPCNTLADILERLDLSSILLETFDHPPAPRPDDPCPDGLSRPVLFQRWLVRWKCPTLPDKELACFTSEDERTASYIQYYREELEPLPARVERLKAEALTEFEAVAVPTGPGRWSPGIRPNHHALLELLYVDPGAALALLRTLRDRYPERHRLLLVLLTDLDHFSCESDLSSWLGRKVTEDTQAHVRLMLRELAGVLAG